MIPAGIAWSNGRIEADEIDIETKFSGRVATLFADEGDIVSRGQIVAEMDTRDLQDAMHRDEAMGTPGPSQSSLTIGDFEVNQLRLAFSVLTRCWPTRSPPQPDAITRYLYC